MKKIIIILGLVIAGAVTYVFLPEKKDDDEKVYQKMAIEVKDIIDFVEASGEVSAENTKKVYIDEKLKVDEVFFNKGDYVKQGQLIMTFDGTERNDLNRKIRKDNLEIRKLTRDISNGRELLALGGISKKEVEDLAVELKQKRIDIEEYREKLSKMVTSVSSPFEGTIISMEAEENYRVNIEKELFEIADLSNIFIKVFVPEYDIKKIQVGQKVRVKPEIYEKKKVLKGVVEKISTLSTDDETFSKESEAYVEVEIELDRIDENLMPGFTVDTEIIILNIKNTVSVPRSAILEKNGKTIIFTVDSQSKLKAKEVKLGTITRSNIQIKSGLKDGEEIIINPNPTLKTGDIVKIGEPKMRAKKTKGNNKFAKKNTPKMR